MNFAILLFVGCLVALVALALLLGPEDKSASLNWHRAKGDYRVEHYDGHWSQSFTWRVARRYASMFGGDVVSRSRWPEKLH